MKTGKNKLSEDYLYFSANKSFGEKTFVEGSFKIKGLIKDDRNLIFQNPSFTISFFRDYLYISSFNLIPTSIALNLTENSDVETLMQKLTRAFPKYTFSNPLLEIGNSIENAMNYVIEIILLFSIISSAISLFLQFTIVYLNIIESKNDSFLLKSLGFSKGQIDRFFIADSFVHGIVSSGISLITLVFSQIFMNYILAQSLQSEFILTIDMKPVIIPIISGLILSLFISFVSCILINRNKKKKFSSI